MTFREFHNSMRILSSIDYREFADAIRSAGELATAPEDEWLQFSDDTWWWFTHAPEAQAQAVWDIVERRMTKASDD